jgi:hypothetical protein
MIISFADLEEEGEFSLEDNSKGIYGLVSSDQEILARYFVYWCPGAPKEGVVFNLIIGNVHSLEKKVNRQAVSLIHYGLNGPSFIDAKSRPFAKRQALHCSFPDINDHSNDLAISSFNIVDFVLKNDSRLAGCFGARA